MENLFLSLLSGLYTLYLFVLEKFFCMHDESMNYFH